MQITPNEIESVEDAGILDNAPVKLVRTKGGFWIAIGRPKGKMREEALAAGSHPAIVKYNLEKQHPTFQPSLMKSEHFNDSAVVEKHSHFLSNDLRKSGHDLYSVQNGTSIDFHVTKRQIHVATVTGQIEGDAIVFKELKVGKEFSRALAGATVEKAMSSGSLKVKIKG